MLPQSDQNPDEPLVKPKEHTNDNQEAAVPVAPTMQARNAQYSASALCLMAEVFSAFKSNSVFRVRNKWISELGRAPLQNFRKVLCHLSTS